MRRPFIVAEFSYQMNWHGRDWTVGCLTAEAAERSFQRRVANNMAAYGKAGAVIAYETATLLPLLWTSEVIDPHAVLDYFVKPRP